MKKWKKGVYSFALLYLLSITAIGLAVLLAVLVRANMDYPFLLVPESIIGAIIVIGLYEDAK